MVPVGHQKPQRFPVPISARLGRARGGQQLAGRTQRIDRVGFPGSPLAHVRGVADLGDLFPGSGQVPGQVQAVMPGTFHRPDQGAASGLGTGPGQQLLIAGLGRRDLPSGHQVAPAITDRRGVGVQMGIHPGHKIRVSGNAHVILPMVRSWQRRHRPG